MNKVIALDIGNVCLRIDQTSWLGYLENSLHNKAVINSILSTKTEFELGVISQSSFISQLNKITGNNFSDNEIISIYCLILKDEIEGMSEFIHDLVKLGYKIMFFSDTSEIHLYEVRRKLSFSNLIIGGVYSFEVGVYKPDIKIFQEFEKRYGKPEFYIDDLLDNCCTADKLGWKAHCFASVESCRKEIIG